MLVDESINVNITHENLVKAEKEKLSKYLDFTREITDLWNM